VVDRGRVGRRRRHRRQNPRGDSDHAGRLTSWRALRVLSTAAPSWRSPVGLALRPYRSLMFFSRYHTPVRGRSHPALPGALFSRRGPSVREPVSPSRPTRFDTNRRHPGHRGPSSVPCQSPDDELSVSSRSPASPRTAPSRIRRPPRNRRRLTCRRPDRSRIRERGRSEPRPSPARQRTGPRVGGEDRVARRSVRGRPPSSSACWTPLPQ